MAKQSRQRCSWTFLAILVSINSHISAPHLQIYPYEKMALRKISSVFHVLTVPLQEYTSPPHDLPQWLLSNNGTILHNMIT